MNLRSSKVFVEFLWGPSQFNMFTNWNRFPMIACRWSRGLQRYPIICLMNLSGRIVQRDRYCDCSKIVNGFFHKYGDLNIKLEDIIKIKLSELDSSICLVTISFCRSATRHHHLTSGHGRLCMRWTTSMPKPQRIQMFSFSKCPDLQQRTCINKCLKHQKK